MIKKINCFNFDTGDGQRRAAAGAEAAAEHGEDPGEEAQAGPGRAGAAARRQAGKLVGQDQECGRLTHAQATKSSQAIKNRNIYKQKHL